MLAHTNTQLLIKSQLGQALGVSANTIQKYLDILEGTYIIKQLQPYHANVKKRLVKSPKVYIRDTGLLHHLLGIENYNDLLGHPIIGSSFESLVITSIIENLPGYKASTTPKLTQGFFESIKVIQPTTSYVIANIDSSYPIKDDIYAYPLQELIQKLT